MYHKPHQVANDETLVTCCSFHVTCIMFRERIIIHHKCPHNALQMWSSYRGLLALAIKENTAQTNTIWSYQMKIERKIHHMMTCVPSLKTLAAV